jgi:tetratricopeptide (TPR) repeat protein
VANPEDEVGDLHAALTALHAFAGVPSDRQIEAYASFAGYRLPRATASTTRLGRAVPQWETVEAFVAACQMYAKTRKPPIRIPAIYADVPLWRKRHEEVTAIAVAARTKKAQGKMSLSTQLPRSSNSPTRLLNPGSGVVEFVGRVAELDDLLAWCQDGSAGRLRLITGPGGIGKTRLALQLAKELKEFRWQCEWVGDRQEARILADVRADSSAPLLLVVDYAETRIGLEDLLRTVAADPGTLRVLLLARSAGQWWEQLAVGEGAIRDLVVEAGLDGIRLGEVLDDQVKDEDEVLRAVPLFATALGVAPPAHVAVATPTRRTRVLELHAAALVAVLEWIEAPRRQPLVRLNGILDELLLHEGHFWNGSARARGLMDGQDGLELSQLRQVVAAGCLLGAANQDEAVALLGRVPGIRPSVKLATWLRELYPPGHDSTEWLGVMQPDRLAERLVVSALGESEALTQAFLSDLGERQAHRALLLLARAATEDDIAERLLRRLLPLVAQVVEGIDAPLETLVSIANAIPYPSMVLGSAHDVITRRILAAPATSTNPVERARWLTIRALTLTQLGRSVEALPVIQEAADLYRELAAASAGRYGPELAASLAHLGIAYSELGCPAEGLEASAEAAGLYREMVSAHPSWYQPDLAATLVNLGTRLSELGRPVEALGVTQEAVRLYRGLATTNPDRYQPDLAATLANLGARFSELGRPSDALKVTQEAAGLLQNVIAVNPERYRPNVAGFLASLGGQFLDLGRPAEALSAGQEALRLYRELAKANPDGYRPSLAVTLAKLGNTFRSLGCHAEALEATREAAMLYRQLTSVNPDRYRYDFAVALMSLGDRFSQLKRPAEALDSEREAIGLYRELVGVNFRRYTPELALNLMILGARYSELERPAPAMSVEQEAIGLYRGLAETNPDWFRPNLALALMIFGAQLSKSGRPVDALPPEQEAISLYRLQATINPERYQPHLAASLTSLGFRLSDLGRPVEALTAVREAVGLYQELTSTATGQQHPALAAILAESGSETPDLVLQPAQEEVSLYGTLREAKSLYRELAAADPDRYRPDLALSLINLGARFSVLRQPEEALSAVQEAVRLYRDLAASDPDWYRPNLALALMILGDRLAEWGRPTEALSTAQEAVCLYREMAAANPGRYQPILAASLTSLGFRFSELDRAVEALKATREAASLYRELVAVSQEEHQPATAAGSGPASPGLDGIPAALTAAQDAVGLYRTLAAVNPNRHRPALARGLINLGDLLWRANRKAEALFVQREAIGQYRELATLYPRQYDSDLTNALTDLAVGLTALGNESEAAEIRAEAGDTGK